MSVCVCVCACVRACVLVCLCARVSMDCMCHLLIISHRTTRVTLVTTDQRKTAADGETSEGRRMCVCVCVCVCVRVCERTLKDNGMDGEIHCSFSTQNTACVCVFGADKQREEHTRHSLKLHRKTNAASDKQNPPFHVYIRCCACQYVHTHTHTHNFNTS